MFNSWSINEDKLFIFSIDSFFLISIIFHKVSLSSFISFKYLSLAKSVISNYLQNLSPVSRYKNDLHFFENSIYLFRN